MSKIKIDEKSFENLNCIDGGKTIVCRELTNNYGYYDELPEYVKDDILQEWNILGRGTLVVNDVLIESIPSLSLWKNANINCPSLTIDRQVEEKYTLEKNILPIEVVSISDILNLNTSNENKSALIWIIEHL